MEIVHIAETEDHNYLLTYLFSKEEFKAIQEEATLKGELNDETDDILGHSV